MKILPATSLLLLFISGAVAADDQSNVAFKDGSVIIHCAAPSKQQQISVDIFNEAFPLWITELQNFANEGKIARAHYLNDLREGIFIAVRGEDRKQAMSHALEIQGMNQLIMKEALAKAGVEEVNFDPAKACQFIEIGPVAILPQN